MSSERAVRLVRSTCMASKNEAMDLTGSSSCSVIGVSVKLTFGIDVTNYKETYEVSELTG